MSGGGKVEVQVAAPPQERSSCNDSGWMTQGNPSSFHIIFISRSEGYSLPTRKWMPCLFLGGQGEVASHTHTYTHTASLKTGHVSFSLCPSISCWQSKCWASFLMSLCFPGRFACLHQRRDLPHCFTLFPANLSPPPSPDTGTMNREEDSVYLEQSGIAK